MNNIEHFVFEHFRKFYSEWTFFYSSEKLKICTAYSLHIFYVSVFLLLK